MNSPQQPSKGTVEQLRETLERLVPLLQPDVEPAVVLELDQPSGDRG